MAKKNAASKISLTMIAFVLLRFLVLPMAIGQKYENEELGFAENEKPNVTVPNKGSIVVAPIVHTPSEHPEIEVDSPGMAEPDQEEHVRDYEKLYTERDAIALAKMAWGEALVTLSDTEMAATMWCALNRFDSNDPYYRNCKTIEDVVLQKGAFAGYSAGNPLDDHLLWLAFDVLDRWNAEQHGETDVGRVLPSDYLFFHGDGKHNHFRKEYKHNGYYWDWSVESPYKN